MNIDTTMSAIGGFVLGAVATLLLLLVGPDNPQLAACQQTIKHAETLSASYADLTAATTHYLNTLPATLQAAFDHDATGLERARGDLRVFSAAVDNATVVVQTVGVEYTKSKEACDA